MFNFLSKLLPTLETEDKLRREWRVGEAYLFLFSVAFGTLSFLLWVKI